MIMFDKVAEFQLIIELLVVKFYSKVAEFPTDYIAFGSKVLFRFLKALIFYLVKIRQMNRVDILGYRTIISNL